MLQKRKLGVNVLDAARQRIAWAFDTYSRLYVSFSGGKDSGVMLHLVMEEAKRRNQKVGVLTIDWEAQFNLTIQFVEQMFSMYADYIEPYWVALPFLTTNACSQFEPEWICWEDGKQSDWVRPLPPQAISDYLFELKERLCIKHKAKFLRGIANPVSKKVFDDRGWLIIRQAGKWTHYQKEINRVESD